MTGLLDFAISEMAREVLRRAVIDADTADGWGRLPDLGEQDYDRVVSRLRDFLAELDQIHGIVPFEEDHYEGQSRGFDLAYAWLSDRAEANG